MPKRNKATSTFAKFRGSKARPKTAQEKDREKGKLKTRQTVFTPRG